MRRWLLAMVLSACGLALGCGGGSGGGDGGSGEDGGGNGDFDNKAGAWAGDNGCMIGLMTVDPTQPNVTFDFSNDSEGPISTATTSASEVSLFGTHTINGVMANWFCMITCVDADTIAFSCTNQDDSTSCSEMFMPATP